MPRVPTYEPGQVQQGVAPLPELGAPDVTRRSREFAGALDKTGDLVNAIQERDAQKEAFDAELKLRTDWATQRVKLREQFKGDQAGRYEEEANRWWAEAPGKYGAELSPRAKSMSTRALGSLRASAIADTAEYVTGERKRAREVTFHALQGEDIAEVGRQLTPDNALTLGAVTAARITKRAVDYATREGLPSEVGVQMATTLTGKMHADVVLALAAKPGAAAQAQAYFKEFEKDIPLALRDNVAERLKAKTLSSEGEAAASTVWEQAKPTTPGAIVEVDKLQDMVRAAMKGADPKAVAEGVAAISSRVQAYEHAERQRQSASTATLMAAYSKGATLAQLRQMPEMDLLPDKGASIVQYITDRQHMMWARSIEDRLRLEREAERRSLPVFYDYADPARLAQMTRPEVQALEPVLGARLVGELLQKHEALQKPKGFQRASVDREMFLVAAEDAGLRPNAPHKTEEDKTKLVQFQRAVETAIAMKQDVLKRELSHGEKQEIVDQVTKDQVYLPKFFGFGERAAPPSTLTKDEAAKAYVTVGGQKVQLSTIPADFRQRVLSARGARGLPTSEADVAADWLAFRSRQQPQAK